MHRPHTSSCPLYKDGHYVRTISHLSFLSSGKPYIIAVYPQEGWTSGGTRVCIVGMNFYEGVEVVFGTLSASAEVRTLGAMHMLVQVQPPEYVLQHAVILVLS